MFRSSVMDDFIFRKSQKQYKVATDTVLGWLRTVTGQPEKTSVSYHKSLASVAVQAGILMPPYVWVDLCRAITLQQECKQHHEVRGSNDKGHAYILAVFEDIQTTYHLAASPAPRTQRALYETAVCAAAPLPQCMVAPFTPPPSPPAIMPFTLPPPPPMGALFIPPPPPLPMPAPYGWPASLLTPAFTEAPVNNIAWPAPSYMQYDDFYGNTTYTGCQYPQLAQQYMAVQQQN